MIVSLFSIVASGQIISVSQLTCNANCLNPEASTTCTVTLNGAATVGLVSSYVDSNVQDGQTYYYVTTAVDATGAESGYSNEASAAVPDGVSQSATIRLVAIPSRRVSAGPFPLDRRSLACGASLPESAPQ
jgi:hypothetical protein